MREHAYRMNELMMQHGHVLHHGPGLVALLLAAAVWGVAMVCGWRLFRNGAGGYKLLGLLLIGIGLLPLSGILIPALLIGVLVWIWKKGKRVSREREWADVVSAAAAAASVRPGYDVLDEWERKLRNNQNQTKGE
ncbi:hypothetical protein [Effusibacillus dendaii]|uniref:Uncharacterized protein n=1 Tax=Effusibacillus dendaii TaxID=2743772 RepID=A0A7I8D8P9_9BACL|nr:hypothetical protein [Effusibacillus dendaii]BCJ85379.1 hypothetical protein skT53_03640 [Effusibacillus dendaii]